MYCPPGSIGGVGCKSPHILVSLVCTGLLIVLSSRQFVPPQNQEIISLNFHYFLELSIFPAADAASNLLVLIYWFNFLPIYFPPSRRKSGFRDHRRHLRRHHHHRLRLRLLRCRQERGMTQCLSRKNSLRGCRHCRPDSQTP